MRFGIGLENEMTLEEIGQIEGVTRERIRQIEAKGIDPIRLAIDGTDVVDTVAGEADLVDSASGEVHRVPRARGFRGHCLLEIRDPESLGYCLSPAVVPVHDPALITTLPSTVGWYHHEGCAHLSVEAFWQMSKVVEVRYDRFVALGPDRLRPLDGLG